MYAAVLFTNVSSASCRVEGYPDLVGIRSDGSEVPLATQQAGDLLPTDLDSGQAAWLQLGTGQACPALNQPDQQAVAANAAANTYSGIVIELPDGSGSITVTGLSLDTACGSIVESQIGVQLPSIPFALTTPPNFEPSVDTLPTWSGIPGSLGNLVVQLRHSRPVRTGSVFHYEVILSNPDAAAVSFRKCPTYTEALGVITKKIMLTTRTYVLNCRPARSVPAHGSVTLAMEINVAPGFAKGPVTVATFGWRLNVEGGPYPFASSSVKVTK